MSWPLLPVFLLGLLGSVHCVGMCGGIVAAFSSAAPGRPAFPVRVATLTLSPPAATGSLLRVGAYNAGRLGSYAVAGALAGGMAGGLQAALDLAALRLAMYWLANGMLLALGLYLMDAWRGLSRLERAGQMVWRHVQPALRQLLPVDHPAKALALGALWGWVPCGMVYSVLTTAMLSGSAASGAAVMLAFGLGTLPALMGMGLAGEKLRVLVRRRAVRQLAGAIVAGFGLLGLWRAAGGMHGGWLDVLCLTPGMQS